MSDIVKEVIVQRAKHFLELRQAEAQLAEIEKQEQAEAQQQQQEENLLKAQSLFNTISEKFLSQKAESDSAILAWAEQGVLLLERRHSLRDQSIKVSEAARSLAYALLSSGRNPTLAGFGQSDAIRMQSEELLKARTGHSQLMTLPIANDRNGFLLDAFRRVTGDIVLPAKK